LRLLSSFPKKNKLIVGKICSLSFYFTVKMKYSLFSVMEYRFGIFPPSAPEKINVENFDFEPIFLLASPDSDFEIKLRAEKSSDEFYVSLAIAALGAYFFEIRGLPLEEIKISHSVSNFIIKNTKKILSNPSKCKYKFSKRTSEINGARVEYTTVANSLIFSAENICDFDENVLALAQIKERDTYYAALVYSISEGDAYIKKRGKLSMLESALMISRLLMIDGRFGIGEEINFHFDCGQKIKIKNLGDLLLEIGIEAEFLGFFE